MIENTKFLDDVVQLLRDAISKEIEYYFTKSTPGSDGYYGTCLDEKKKSNMAWNKFKDKLIG